jgi:NTE family protein
MQQDVIENLVFEGGGVKGVAFVGAVRYLENNNLMSNVKKIIGSSAGAIIAAGLSVGYNADELDDILMNVNFSKFCDDSVGLIRDCIRLFKEYGLYKGDKYLEWLGSIIKDKTGSSETTFYQIYKLYNIDLVITGTNINTRQVTYFNYKDYPDMPIKLAVRISCSIPIIFRCIEFNNDIYVDGGVLDNYPIWYFPDYTKTLGFKLVEPGDKRDDIIYHNRLEVKNVIDYTKCIIDALLSQNERLHIKNDYWKRTVTINSFNISATNFNITMDQKRQLIDEGFKSTERFFESDDELELDNED